MWKLGVCGPVNQSVVLMPVDFPRVDQKGHGSRGRFPCANGLIFCTFHLRMNKNLRCRKHRATAHICFLKPDLIVFGFYAPFSFLFPERIDFLKTLGNFLEVITYFLSRGCLCLPKQSQIRALLSLLYAVWFLLLVPSPSSFRLFC